MANKEKMWYNKRVKKRCFMKEIGIFTDYITLGQFLKLSGAIGNGGEARFFLQKHSVYVCGEPENRRGRKLKPDDLIEIDGRIFKIVKKYDN